MSFAGPKNVIVRADIVSAVRLMNRHSLQAAEIRRRNGTRTQADRDRITVLL